MRREVSKIDEITEVVTKGTTPTTYGMPFTDSGVNFIKAEALNGNSSLDRAGFAFVSESTHERLKRSILAEGDILVTIAGAQVGRCGIVRAEHLPANTNQAVGIIRVLRERANPRFVYYFFKNPQTFRMCQGIGGQAAQPNINLTVLKGFDLPLPDLQNQDAIVGVLSAYDDLIENNQRRIALLEEAARLLYREWFVHFRFPGHEHLKIINGLPEGWVKRELCELAKINKGRNITKNNIEDGEVPVVAGGLKPAYYHNVSNAKSPVVTVSASGANAGFVALYLKDIWASDCSYMTINENPHIWFWYLTLKCRQIEISSMQQGAAQPHVYPRHLRRMQVVMPPLRLLEELDELVGRFFAMVRNLQAQTDSLTAARDLLLPRLMNGEIAV